jgi:hypothetical protein
MPALILRPQQGGLWNDLSSFCCFSLMTIVFTSPFAIVVFFLVLDSLSSSNSLASTFAYTHSIRGKHSLHSLAAAAFVLFAPPADFHPLSHLPSSTRDRQADILNQLLFE